MQPDIAYNRDCAFVTTAKIGLTLPTMKTLTIIRHAKAERPEGYPSDFDRPLTDRGLKDATRIGEVLARLEPSVDWWISSPAVRAQQTTERLRARITDPQTVQWEPTIYEASADTLLDLLGNVPQEVQHVVLVGHNPGMEELVAGLVAGAPERLGIHMATAALAHIHLEIFWWNQIRWGCGKLELLLTPKVVKK
jgi:phosphohistidine phosphatase